MISYADLTSFELLFSSFSDQVLVQNVSNQNDLIFMTTNIQVTYIKFSTDFFCHRRKSQLGIGLFIHELAQEAFVLAGCFLRKS